MDLWIGFNSLDIDQTYTWSDKTPVNFIYWATNNPYNSYKQEKCAALRVSGVYFLYS